MEAACAFPPRFHRLRDGAEVVTRPITPADGPALSLGLTRLSPRGNAYRFLHQRKRFTPQELAYLTHCDFRDHFALILGAVDPAGREIDQVGVARCIRDPGHPASAEAAIVLVDAWQGRGAGTFLLRHLADLAREAGIARWEALFAQGNAGAEHVFARIGREISRRSAGGDTDRVTYALPPGTDSPKA